MVGIARSHQLGSLVLFGLGGIFLPVSEDTPFRVAPMSGTAVLAMTEEIRASPLLRGARGRLELAVDELFETIYRVSQRSVDIPAIEALAIDPLVGFPDGVSAIDLQLTVDSDRRLASTSMPHEPNRPPYEDQP